MTDAPETVQEPKVDPELEKKIDEIRKLVEKTDTPAAHGALAEILYTTNEPEHQKESISHFEIASKAGIVAATAYLGDAYFNGRGVEKDVAKGMDLFMDAAMDGDVDALYSIGAAYLEGQTIAPDYEKALDFLAEASSKGSPRAANALGLMYLGGFGTEQNIAKAKRLFEKALQKGNEHSRKNLELIKKMGRRFDFHQFILDSFAGKVTEQ
ncbi:MAG: sel1 repeat family protein [archaeon]|nr:sel1 repeat family protein [archaeon]